MGIDVEWDYTDRAAFYDKRADYSTEAVFAVLQSMNLVAGDRVADVGAGTAKLTKVLLEYGLTVNAVEPNDAMRGFGIENTKGGTVEWREGTGEDTGLESDSYKSVFFGSSFNVVDQQKTLNEARRICVDRGFFCCMWNHRDLNDPIQSAIEAKINSMVDGYDYGTRRQDPTAVLAGSGLFDEVKTTSGTLVVSLPCKEVMDAWRSHHTLALNAGDAFPQVIEEIEKILAPYEAIDQPFTTRIWYAQFA